MKNTIIGAVIGLALGIGGIAMAQTAQHGMVVVSTLDTPYLTHVNKVYDYDNDVVCYEALSYGSGSVAISCLQSKQTATVSPNL